MKSALDTADDPNRVAARRNVLAKDGPPADGAAEPRVGRDRGGQRAAVDARPRPKRRTLTAAPVAGHRGRRPRTAPPCARRPPARRPPRRRRRGDQEASGRPPVSKAPPRRTKS